MFFGETPPSSAFRTFFYFHLRWACSGQLAWLECPRLIRFASFWRCTECWREHSPCPRWRRHLQTPTGGRGGWGGAAAGASRGAGGSAGRGAENDAGGDAVGRPLGGATGRKRCWRGNGLNPTLTRILQWIFLETKVACEKMAKHDFTVG